MSVSGPCSESVPQSLETGAFSDLSQRRPDKWDIEPDRIDTRRVKFRRKVRYAGFDEFLVDAEWLAGRPVRQLGNWALAQIFDHLARSMTVSVDGTRERFSWSLRIGLRLARARIIGRPMKPGYRVPENVAVLLRPDRGAGLHESLTKLRSAIMRFRATSEFPPHPAFGALTRNEYCTLALRHAELHLSFVEPVDATVAALQIGKPEE